MNRPTNLSYGRILKSSTLLGGSSIIAIALGIIRTKVLAVQLGPGLFGVMGLYAAFLGMMGTIAGLGLAQSAVRDIAVAAGSGDEQRIGQTMTAFGRVVWATGLAGLLATLLLAWPASQWTFGDHEHALAFACLAVTVLFSQLTAGQTALLQGLRRVRDISALSVAGAALSTVLAIPLLLLFGERGIVPFLLAVSGGTLLGSWWYARRVRVVRVQQSWRETWAYSRHMVGLGTALMGGALVATLGAYLIRLILQEHVGEVGVGLYQAAFTISSLYVGFLLSAMGTDYYPSLAGVAHDSAEMSRRVNEQADMAMLLGVPGLVAAIIFSDWIIAGFYSAEFHGAGAVLRWTVLGLFGRLVSWPVGFILLARSDRNGFFCTEVFAQTLHVGLAVLLVRSFGLEGAGMAFAGLYAAYVVVIYLVGRYRHGFHWRAATARLIVAGALFVAIAFLSTYVTDRQWRYVLQGTILALSVLLAVAGLYRLLGHERIIAASLRLRTRLGLVRG